ncbi:hypothetical protein F2Q69_00016420 [Brassica cretica]|uniref:Uncharacterized protein n=1 Tax=Brassica cretica TaxID=69181 RepID=A0A8S9R141_BRACR|nr:hypothetical protein F2Q69_00016420 [Brassica cretica]
MAKTLDKSNKRKFLNSIFKFHVKLTGFHGRPHARRGKGLKRRLRSDVPSGCNETRRVRALVRWIIRDCQQLQGQHMFTPFMLGNQYHPVYGGGIIRWRLHASHVG